LLQKRRKIGESAALLVGVMVLIVNRPAEKQYISISVPEGKSAQTIIVVYRKK